MVWWPCGNDNKDAPPPVSEWQILYSPGMPARPTPHGSGWLFDFPTAGSVHYVVRGHRGSIGGSVASQFEITGNAPEFNHVDPKETNPCWASLYFQRSGDDLTADKQFYRWWSIERVLLQLTPRRNWVVPLIPDAWTSVFGVPGSDAPGEFQAAMSDCQAVGITFGGNSFAGHGVRLTAGDASITMHGFSVG